ncbi:MAG: hypothetical protein KKA80_04430, partial [Candidatus Omnitrophica bacterium]|nr:hypothetical protein [Candidatus Omnitrophota bacterium]
LQRLGGFAKIMPVTFITFLIAAFAISGVPPFNGFASKWLVYQGVIESGRQGGGLWVIWLIAAIFGSVLTLASFMKAVHAVFLGQPSNALRTTHDARRESHPAMLIPSVFLALLCIIFGVFAYRIPLKLFIFPSLSQKVVFSGIWNANLATALLLAGIIVGIVIYLLGRVAETRETEVFVGGELLKEHPDMRVSGTGFYDTIQDIGILRGIYRKAKRGVFDPYEIGRKITFAFTGILHYIHNGVLSTYLAWCLLGMGILFYVLLR